MYKPILFLLFISTVSLMACQEKPDTTMDKPLNYPPTEKGEVVDVYHGKEVSDPYRWLEDDRSSATAAWVKTQNQTTFGYLDQIPFRDKLKDRLAQLMDYEKVYPPTVHGDHTYYYRNEGLQNQAVLYRTKTEGGTEEVFLDPNGFKEDGTISMAGTSFTQDGKLLAYLISEGGSDWRKAIVMDTETKTVAEDTLKNIKFSGLSWYKNEGFYYSSYEIPKDGSVLSAKTQHHQLFYHRLGTPQSEDRLVFGGAAQPFRYISGRVSEDNRFLIIWAAESTTGNQLFVQDLSQPNSSIVALVDNFDNDYTFLDNDGDKLLLLTNDSAPNFKVITIDANALDKTQWSDLIPETEHVLSAGTAGGKLFGNYLVDANTKVKQFDYKGNFEREVELPGIGSAFGFRGEKGDKELYYTFTSFTEPGTIYKYNLESGLSDLYNRPEIDFDPERFETKQVFYTSKDGTKVPMFIVHKKGLELDGNNPTYLYAYGGFGVNLRPTFSTSRVVWLENGGIYAQPNLRGGGEYGVEWHKAGTKMNKQNVFDDFIAAAEYLVQEKYTSPERLAIAGGSNGGLLVGATMAQRPDLMKVALPAVGVLDMLRYHKFTAGAGWAYDYGTADESKEMFEYLLGYSPLHNLKEGTAYPATLVTTGDHDDRVVPAHSFKFAARLQACQGGDAPTLIRIETDAGHGSGTPLSKQIEADADRFSFVWYAMGISPEMAQAKAVAQ